MKSLPLFAIFAISTASTLAVAADTAYDAVRSACAKVGKDAQNRVLELSGQAGRPQPFIWHVTVSEDGAKGGVLVVDVQHGNVVGQRRIAKAAAGTRLNMASIQLDSDGAFSVANSEAVRAGISFDRLNYNLNSNNQAGFPLWSVELLDGPNRRVGSLKISADTGTVVERSAELEITEEQKREARWSKPGTPYRSVPDFFHRAGKSVEKTGWKLKNWANGYGWTDEKSPAVPSNQP